MRKRRCGGGDGRARAVIIGAGQAGRTVARTLEAGGHLAPVGFLDDAPPGDTVSGIPVLGGTPDIADAAWPVRAHVAVVAIPSLPPARVAELVERVCEAGLDVRYVPPGGPATSLLRLLGRDELRVAGTRARRFVAGRRVLVTGACGAVGARLCRRLRTLRPAALLQLDADEDALARLTAEGPADVSRSVVADIRDGTRVDAVFEEFRPELVLHAAGFNNDPRSLERRPSAAVRTNVLGTRNLARAALRRDVERFVLVSTDQAAEPISVLGATRRLSELVLQAEAGSTCFAAVRVGCVLGSGASPFRGLARRLAAGEPVTVPHPDAVRHLMSAREAAELVLEATAMAEDAETFALDTGEPTSILAAVGALVDGLRVPDAAIRFTGLGPGERLRSRSFAASEETVRTAHPLIRATRATVPGDGRIEPLSALLAAAADGADDRVRALMRRILPEYRPREDRR